MSKYSQEEIKKHFDQLPEKLKQTLFSAEVADTMVGIGKKYNLTIEKIGFMAEETGNIILGLTRPEDFLKILKERLQTIDDIAPQIVADINSQVLAPLREVLKSAFQFELPEDNPQKIPAFMQGMQIPDEEPVNQEKTEIPSTPKPITPTPVSTPAQTPPKTSAPTNQPNIIMPNTDNKSAGPTIDLRTMAMEKIAPPEKEELLSPPSTKIPPIDLRNQTKPAMSPVSPKLSVSTAPPKIPEAATTPVKEIPIASGSQNPAQPAAPTKTAMPKPVVPTPKVAPDKGFDPYREPIED